MNNYGGRRRANRQQLDLFEIGHNGAPAPGRETRRLYQVVLFLRIYGGKNVWRAGSEHLVGRRQVSTKQLLALCAADCRRECRSDEIPPYALQRLGF